TIDREDRRNALSPEVIESLLANLQSATQFPDIKVVVITGAGDHAFCAGGDLGGMAAAEGRVAEHDRRARLADLFTAMVDHPKPIIARVNGLALAGGFGLALACDLIVASESAAFGT